eukprot:4816-Heterococcus_DN1.PRE.2
MSTFSYDCSASSRCCHSGSNSPTSKQQCDILVYTNAQGLGNAHMQPCTNTMLSANRCSSCHSTYQIGCIATARAARVKK